MQELIKIKSNKKTYLRDYNLLIAQNLWQAHYQILLIILWKEFVKLNVNDNKKCETCEINYKDCECFLEYINFKDNLIEDRCLCWNKNYKKKFDENLQKEFFNINKFLNHDINKFILLLQKGVYPYNYIDD